MAALVSVTIAGFAVVAVVATSSRNDSTRAVSTQTEPLLTEAQGLYAALSDANATAATTFLTGGIEPRQRRLRYLADLHQASSELTLLTRQVGGSPAAGSAVATISARLPVYAGLIETARTDNRQVLPVGAAYIRQASGMMRDQLLPASNELYTVEAQRLASDYHSGTSSQETGAVTAAAVVALAMLVIAQIAIARRSRRVFNIPLVAASAVVLACGLWLLTGFVLEQRALARAQRGGSNTVEVMSAMRILTLRAEGDESLALIARGGGDQDNADFLAVEHAFGHPLINEAMATSAATGTSAGLNRFLGAFTVYRDQHASIVNREQNGRFVQAISRAVGPHATEPRAVALMNAGLNSEMAAAQARFDSSANDASSALTGLRLGVPLLMLVSIGLALAGFRQRIGEYR